MSADMNPHERMHGETEDAGFPLRVFFGHHKCATGWIDNILREVCLHMGLRFRIVHQPYSFGGHGDPGALVRAERLEFLSYITATSQFVKTLSPYRAFHVVRDPRDIVVSAYYSHLKSLESPTWKELATIRSTLEGLSKEDGLYFEIDYLAPQFNEMAEWNYEQPNVLELKLEDLSRDPTQGFVDIFRFLNMLDEERRSSPERLLLDARLVLNRLNHRGRRFMPGRIPLFPVPKRPVHVVPIETVVRQTEKFSFARLAGGRRKGQEDQASHYRKGIHGDWKNHFSPDHIRRFKSEYGGLLVKLGYERDEDW